MNPKTPPTLTVQKSMCWASKEFQQSRGNKTPMKIHPMRYYMISAIWRLQITGSKSEYRGEGNPSLLGG